MIALTNLPPEAFWAIRDHARSAAWEAVNTRLGNYTGAQENKHQIEEQFKLFKGYLEQLSASEPTIWGLRWASEKAAWGEADYVFGQGDAAGNLSKFVEYIDTVKKAGDLDTSLVDQLGLMARTGALWVAYTKSQRSEDADRAGQAYNDAIDGLGGDVTLLRLDFHPDRSQIHSVEPETTESDVITNPFNVEDSETITATRQTSSTQNWTKKLLFKTSVSVKSSFDLLAVKGDVTISAEVSYEYLWGSTVTSSVTDTRSFVVKIPPFTKARVDATVQNISASVPYELVYLVSGVERRLAGDWQGVAVSDWTINVVSLGPAPATA